MKLSHTIYFLLTTYNIFAQSNEIKRETKYTAEVGTIISSNGETPFWLRTNQYGTVPNQSPVFTLRGSVSSDYKKAITKEDQYKLSKFDWGYGLNIVGNVGKENQFLIPEAYVKAKCGAFEIYAGRRKEIFGLVDSTLSSGSYIWSGNVLPMPKIQISTPNFVPLPFTKGFLSFKGNYAHGWFENSRTDVKNFYLHQKSLYFRLGKPDWKFLFYGGFNHQVQWGGELLYPDPTNQFAINGQVGSSFNDYINVVTGRSLAGVGDTTKNGGNDALNRSGNHLGSIDFGFEIHTNKVNILLYRQNIYEDGSLAYLSNISDGLNGVSFTFKNTKRERFLINKLVVEYLNTTNQSGATGSDNTNSRLRGEDNYFNNGVYRDGWTYSKRIIGTPFFTSNLDLSTKPLSNILLKNNKVQAYYLGIKSTLNQTIKLETKLSYSEILGFYGFPFIKPINQFSALMNFDVPSNILGKSHLIFSLSYDNGNLLPNNLGIYAGFRKLY